MTLEHGSTPVNLVCESCSVVSASVRPHGPSSPWNSPGQNTGVGSQFPSPGHLPNPGIAPRSPALQADSFPAEPPGKPDSSLVQGSTKMNLAIKKMHNWCPRETITALLIACKCLWVSKLHDVFLNRCFQGLVYQKMTTLSVFASMSRFCAQPPGTVRSLDVENSAWVLPPTPNIYDLSEVFFFSFWHPFLF